MFDKVCNDKAIQELKLKIKYLQKNLILMSYGHEQDRPLLYSNIRKSLKAAKNSLDSLYFLQIDQNNE